MTTGTGWLGVFTTVTDWVFFASLSLPLSWSWSPAKTGTATMSTPVNTRIVERPHVISKPSSQLRKWVLMQRHSKDPCQGKCRVSNPDEAGAVCQKYVNENQ